MTKNDISAEETERILAALRYDPATGTFTWSHRRGRLKAGDPAGTPNLKGYRQIMFRGRIFFEHRLVWLFATGDWPDRIVDHIDGDKSNNVIANLRLASNAENGQNNRKPRSTNLAGLVGAHAFKGKWRARVGLNGTYKHLGVFDTPEEAHAAYVAEKRRIHKFNTL